MIAEAESLEEIGIYSAVIALGQRIMERTTAGVLVRTKAKDSTEGGVMAGASVIDALAEVPDAALA